MYSDFYAGPSYNSSPRYPIYTGGRRAIGGGILGSFRQFMAPVGRAAVSGIKNIARNENVRNVAKTVLKEAAKRGTEILTNVAVDALQGKNVDEAFREHGKAAALNMLTSLGDSSDDEIRKRKIAKRRITPVAAATTTAAAAPPVATSNVNNFKQSNKRVADPIEELDAGISVKKRRRAETAYRDLF